MRGSRRVLGGEAPPDRVAALVIGARGAAAEQAGGAGGVRHRRDRVDGVRDAGDLGRVGAGRGDGRARLPGADLDRGHRAPGDRDRELPPDALRVSERRRLVHREPREPRDGRFARRGRIVDGRLHAHRGGVDRGGSRRHHLGGAVAARRRGRARTHPARTHRGREPARGPRVGPAVRSADVHVHRDDDAARRRRAVPGRDRLARPASRRPARRWRTSREARRCSPARPRSCCCARSRPARSR